MQEEPNWILAWADEFDGSSLAGAWYIDDYCPRPELVAVSAGVLSVTDSAGCGVDIKTFATFEPALAVEYRARGVPPDGYESYDVAHVELIEASGHHGMGPFIRNGGFHTYRLEWIDGVVYSYVDGAHFGGASTTPFEWPSAYVRLYATRAAPEAESRLEVDYIRVYRRA